MQELETIESDLDIRLEAIRARVSKFRGDETVKVLTEDNTIVVTGVYSYFPQGCSVGTATVVPDSRLLVLKMTTIEAIDYTSMSELTGRSEHCGLGGWEWRKELEDILKEVA